MRTFLSKAKRLLKINNKMGSNENLDNVLNSLRPPIFWKDKDLVKQQIKNYSLENTKLLINSINRTELEIKKNFSNAISILLDFILHQGKPVNSKF